MLTEYHLNNIMINNIYMSIFDNNTFKMHLILEYVREIRAAAVQPDQT